MYLAILHIFGVTDITVMLKLILMTILNSLGTSLIILRLIIGGMTFYLYH
jgi:hypothetical protein